MSDRAGPDAGWHEEEGEEAEDVHKFQSDQEQPADNNPKLFTIEGRPAFFYFYRRRNGGLSMGQIEKLRPKIEAHGGYICDEEWDADTIIAQNEAIKLLKEKYFDSQIIYVERPQFVQMCINTGKYQENHERVQFKAMPGRPPHQLRMDFTAEDDTNLCKYIAGAIPYKNSGGRTGQRIFKRLVKSAKMPGREWVKRHPWESWRNRYNKHQQRLDPIIERYVEKSPPRADGKGQYELSRRHGKQGVRVDLSSEDELSDAYEPSEAEIDDARRKRRRSGADNRARRGAERMKRARRSGTTVSRGRDRSPGSRVASPTLSELLGLEPDEENRSPNVSQVEAGRERVVSLKQSGASATQHDRSRSSTNSVNEVIELLSPERPVAGPSGTQHTSSRSPTLQQPSRPVGKRPSSNNVAARPQTRPIFMGRTTQQAMSSQATLVGPVPTQLRSQRAATHDFDDMYAEPTQVEAMENEGQIHENNRLQPSQLSPQRTAPNARSVPEQLPRVPDASAERRIPLPKTSVRDLPTFKGARRPRINVAEPPPGTRSPLPPPNPTAETAPRRGRAAAQGPTVPPSRAIPQTPMNRSQSAFAAAVQSSGESLEGAAGVADPLTPLRAGDARRRTTNASSSTSDAVPVPGTRASEEKKRRRTTLEEQKQMPYTPALGTRAAATLSQRSRAT